MKSMTGYGYREHQDEERQLVVELRSYNNRYRDIIVNVPQTLGRLEPRIREFLADRIERGRVEITVRFRSLQERLHFSVDSDSIRGFAGILRQIAEIAEIEPEISLSDLLQMEDLVKTQRDVDEDELWDILHPVLENAFTEFEHGRVREGEQTRNSIGDHMVVLEQCLSVFVKHGRYLETHIVKDVRERFDQVMGDKVEEDRVLAETAALLVKFSVDEEVSRLSGHLEAFRAALGRGGPVGKKLDFLCQEINREINTIGSKSPVYELNRQVVEAKDALEKVREQLRNVE